MNSSTSVAGIDVHKAMLAVVVAHPGQELRHSREFTRLCSPKVTHLAERKEPFGARQRRVWRAPNAVAGPALPLPAVDRFPPERGPALGSEEVTRLWRG